MVSTWLRVAGATSVAAFLVVGTLAPRVLRGARPDRLALEQESPLVGIHPYALGQFETATCYAPWLHTFLAWNGDAFLCCMTNGRMEPLGTSFQSATAERSERSSSTAAASLIGHTTASTVSRPSCFSAAIRL